MKRILFSVLFAASLSAEAQTQTFETAFARPFMGHRTKRFFYWSVKMGGRL